MFQELDTPPSRCCWRCGCAMSCVGLITADVDQAFEACSAPAVLPAWRHNSQSYESSFSSNSVLVRRGRRELCKPGRSQSFGRGWFSFSTHVLAPALFSFTSVSLVMLGSMVWQIRGIPFGGVRSSAAVAVVLDAAELVWLDQQQKHWELGFHFRGRPVRSCISWKRYVDEVVVGSRVFCCWCLLYGVSSSGSVCHSGPGSFFAVQPCGPDWSQNRPNVDGVHGVSLRKNRLSQNCRTWMKNKKGLRPKPRNGSSGARRGRSGGRRDSWVAESWPRLHEKEQFFFIVVLQPFSEETTGETAEHQGSAEIVGEA